MTRYTRIALVSCLLLVTPIGVADAAGKKACTSFSVSGDDRGRSIEFVDTGAEGVSVGDRRIGRRTLFDADGNEVGFQMWSITVVDVSEGKPVAYISDQHDLFTDGSLLMHGSGANSRVDDTQRVGGTDETAIETAIVGGTGVYAGARGTSTRSVGNDGATVTTSHNLLCD